MTNFDDFSVITRLDSMCAQFTKTDWKISHYMKENADHFIALPANEIAKILKTSDASIIRFAQKIGFSGLNELKIQYKKEMKSFSNQSLNVQDSLSHFQKDYIVAIERLFSYIPSREMNSFIELISTYQSIYICSFKQYNGLALTFADRFLLAGIKMNSITSYNEFKLHILSAKSNELYIVLNLNDIHNIFQEHFDTLTKTGAKVIVISDLITTKKNDSSLRLTLPKTTDLFSGYSISTNVLFMILTDILFNQLLESDIKEYGKNLIQSLELTGSADDYEIKSTKSKIQLLYEK